MIFSCGEGKEDEGSLDKEITIEMLEDGYTGKGYTFGTGTFKGDKYVGEWKDGKYDGQGTYTWADGTVYKGLWENDKFLGE